MTYTKLILDSLLLFKYNKELLNYFFNTKILFLSFVTNAKRYNCSSWFMELSVTSCNITISWSFLFPMPIIKEIANIVTDIREAENLDIISRNFRLLGYVPGRIRTAGLPLRRSPDHCQSKSCSVHTRHAVKAFLLLFKSFLVNCCQPL